MKYLLIIIILLMSGCSKADNTGDLLYVLEKERCKQGCIYSELFCLNAIQKIGAETGIWPPPKFVDLICVEPREKCALECNKIGGQEQ